MPGYVVTAVFDLDDGRARTGRDVLAAPWGRGHRFSYWDGHRLCLVVEVPASDRISAQEFVLDRVTQLWARLDGGTLPAPSSLQAEPVVPHVLSSPGAVGRGPDSLIAESAARVAARLRAARAAMAELEALELGPVP